METDDEIRCAVFMPLSSSQREGDSLPVELFQNIQEGLYAFSLIFFMGAENAGEAFFAVKGNPCKLAAMIIQKTGRKAHALSGGDVCERGIFRDRLISCIS